MTNTTINLLTPTLIIVRGVPGSGKSYLASELQKLIGGEKVIVLDPDLIDYSSEEYIQFSQDLSLQAIDEKLHPYRFLRSKAYEAINSRRVIIWNQAFTNLDILNRTILNLQNYALQDDVELPALVVEVEVDYETARARVRQRESQGGHGVSDKKFQSFVNNFETFAEYGYPIVSIHGHDSISDSAMKVLTGIELA